MKTTIDNMLTHVYELEGLLLVMQRHHDDVPPEVVKRYKEKAVVVAQEAQQLPLCDDEPPIASVPSSLGKEEENVIIDLDKVDKDCSSSRSMFDAMSISQGARAGQVTPPFPSTPRTQIVLPRVKKPSMPPSFKPKASEVEKTEPVPVYDATSAFSINDRFLFLRELFDNDQQKFDETINHIKTLKSIEEVTSYVSGELHWDMSSDVVVEFMRLIALGYSQGTKQ